MFICLFVLAIQRELALLERRERNPGQAGTNRAQTKKERRWELSWGKRGSQPGNVGRQKGLCLCPLLPGSATAGDSRPLPATFPDGSRFFGQAATVTGKSEEALPGAPVKLSCRDLLTEAGDTNMEMSSLCRRSGKKTAPPLLPFPSWNRRPGSPKHQKRGCRQASDGSSSCANVS